MRATNALALSILLAGCGTQTSADIGMPAPLDALDDPDAVERAVGQTRTLIDPDAPSASVPLEIRDTKLRTIDGTPLSLPSQRERARRARMSAELGDLTTIADDELQLLRLHWYTRGAGIVFQNTSDRALALSIHFRTSADPSCGETVYRGEVPPKTSTAPFAARRDCDYDSAGITIYDQFGLVVARARMTP